jgi:hypothetical protein
MGAFTNALLENLKGGGNHIMILYKNICETLMKDGYSQMPILSTTGMEPNYMLIQTIKN